MNGSGPYGSGPYGNGSYGSGSYGSGPYTYGDGRPVPQDVQVTNTGSGIQNYGTMDVYDSVPGGGYRLQSRSTPSGTQDFQQPSPQSFQQPGPHMNGSGPYGSGPSGNGSYGSGPYTYGDGRPVPQNVQVTNTGSGIQNYGTMDVYDSVPGGGYRLQSRSTPSGTQDFQQPSPQSFQQPGPQNFQQQSPIAPINLGGTQIIINGGVYDAARHNGVCTTNHNGNGVGGVSVVVNGTTVYNEVDHLGERHSQPQAASHQSNRQPSESLTWDLESSSTTTRVSWENTDHPRPMMDLIRCDPNEVQLLVTGGFVNGVDYNGNRHSQPHAAPPTPHGRFPGHETISQTAPVQSFPGHHSNTNHHQAGFQNDHSSPASQGFQTNGSSMSRPPPNQFTGTHNGVAAVTQAAQALVQQTMQQFMPTPSMLNHAGMNYSPPNAFYSSFSDFLPTNSFPAVPQSLLFARAHNLEHSQFYKEYEQALHNWGWPHGTRFAQQHNHMEQPNWNLTEGMWVPSIPGKRAEDFFSPNEIEIMRQNALCYKDSRYYFGMEYRTDDYGLLKHVKRSPSVQQKKYVRFEDPGVAYICLWGHDAVNMDADPRNPGPGEPMWSAERYNPTETEYGPLVASDRSEIEYNRITELEPSEGGSVIDDEQSVTHRRSLEGVRDSKDESEPDFPPPETECLEPHASSKIPLKLATTVLELHFCGVTPEEVMEETGITRQKLEPLYKALGILGDDWNLDKLKKSHSNAEYKEIKERWVDSDYERYKWLHSQDLNKIQDDDVLPENFNELFVPLEDKVVSRSDQEEASVEVNDEPGASDFGNTEKCAQKSSSTCAASQVDEQMEPPMRAAPAHLMPEDIGNKGPAQPSGQSPPDSQPSYADSAVAGGPAGIKRKRPAKTSAASTTKRPKYKFGAQCEDRHLITLSSSDEEDATTNGPAMLTPADRADTVKRSKLTKGGLFTPTLKERERKIAALKMSIAKKEAKLKGVTSAAATPAVTSLSSSGSCFPPPIEANGEPKENVGTVPPRTEAAEQEGAVIPIKAQAHTPTNRAESQKPNDDETADIETLRKALDEQVAAKNKIESNMKIVQESPSHVGEGIHESGVEPTEPQSREKTPEEDGSSKNTLQKVQEEDGHGALQAELEVIEKQAVEMEKRRYEIMKQISRTPAPGRDSSVTPVSATGGSTENPATVASTSPAENCIDDTEMTDVEPSSSDSDSSDSSSCSSDSDSEGESVLHMDDDVEPGVPTNFNSSAWGPAPAVKKEQPGAQAESTRGDFVPYYSPFQYFSSFRHFASFQKSHPGVTLRSLIFSTKLDPTKPLCRFEFSGGVCNDHTCGWQHVRDIEMTGQEVCNALIVPPPWVTGEDDRDKYTRDVAKMLIKLKERGVSSADIIGDALVQYQRKFIDGLENARMNLGG